VNVKQQRGPWSARFGFKTGIVIGVLMWFGTLSAAWERGGFGLGLVDLATDVALFGAVCAAIGGAVGAIQRRTR
jgi:hypothetical protein